MVRPLGRVPAIAHHEAAGALPDHVPAPGAHLRSGQTGSCVGRAGHDVMLDEASWSDLEPDALQLRCDQHPCAPILPLLGYICTHATPLVLDTDSTTWCVHTAMRSPPAATPCTQPHPMPYVSLIHQVVQLSGLSCPEACSCCGTSDQISHLSWERAQHWCGLACLEGRLWACIRASMATLPVLRSVPHWSDQARPCLV